MSIQDDIFDIEHNLNRNVRVADPTHCKFAFERICKWASDLEDERDHLKEQNRILKSAIRIVEKELL